MKTKINILLRSIRVVPKICSHLFSSIRWVRSCNAFSKNARNECVAMYGSGNGWQPSSGRDSNLNFPFRSTEISRNAHHFVTSKLSKDHKIHTSWPSAEFDVGARHREREEEIEKEKKQPHSHFDLVRSQAISVVCCCSFRLCSHGTNTRIARPRAINTPNWWWYRVFSRACGCTGV